MLDEWGSLNMALKPLNVAFKSLNAAVKPLNVTFKSFNVASKVSKPCLSRLTSRSSP
jgi:hypothetical protein